MKRFSILTALFLAFAAPTASGDGSDNIRAKLTGFEEVPVVSTVATGRFRAEISRDEKFIDWSLSYTALQGAVTQSHIHVAQKDVNGVIVIWLCGTPAPGPTGPAGTKTCTPGSGEFSGTISSTDVVAPAPPTQPQQIAAGELAEVIRAIRAGHAYVNVHTDRSPGGEIRGQIRRGGGGHHDHDD